MAYRLDINENFSIYRSRHTGAIGLWERNSAYGYYAAITYLKEGEKLTLSILDAWAIIAGASIAATREAYVEMVRKGGNGMIPNPNFNI